MLSSGTSAKMSLKFLMFGVSYYRSGSRSHVTYSLSNYGPTFGETTHLEVTIGDLGGVHDDGHGKVVGEGERMHERRVRRAARLKGVVAVLAPQLPMHHAHTEGDL